VGVNIGEVVVPAANAPIPEPLVVDAMPPHDKAAASPLLPATHESKAPLPEFMPPPIESQTFGDFLGRINWRNRPERPGKSWGRSLAQSISRELTAHDETPLGQQTIAQVQANLTSALARHGLGRVDFDFARHAHGLIEIAVTDRSPDSPLAGTLAGFFSEIANLDLDCLQTACEQPGGAPARFVVGLPQRLARAADAVREGQPHHCVIALLVSIES
jgi:hypothetical protein